MGYIKHNAIVVTHWDEKTVARSREKAIEIFDEVFKNEGRKGSQLISELIYPVVNSGASFFIAPDGSKEGWGTSDSGDAAREQFLNWMLADKDNYCNYVEVRFGGDDDEYYFVRSRNQDLNNLEND